MEWYFVHHNQSCAKSTFCKWWHSYLYWAYLIHCWYCGIYYRCTEKLVSIFLMDSDVWWSQIEAESSNFGLTSAWYAWVFICWFDVFRFRFKKPSALLPFDVMSLMCLSYLRLDYCYTKIFSWAHRFKYMVMEDVIVLYWSF
jgi:hypothetical protein